MPLLTALLLAAVVFPIASFGQPLTDDARQALAAVQQTLDATWRLCANAAGQKFLATKVLMPEVKPNPFTPPLTPPDAPKLGDTLGYYQLGLYANNLPKIAHGPIALTDADRRNGIEAGYRATLYIPAWRTFDARTGEWIAWQTGQAWEKDHVKVADFTVRRRHGIWAVEDHRYYVHTSGQFAVPSCQEIPAG